MITPELVQYIQKNIAAGKSRGQIQQDLLLAGGWNVNDIQEAFVSIDAQGTGGTKAGTSGSYLGTFMVFLILFAGVVFGAEKFYGPVINEKVAGIISMNPFRAPAPTPAATQASDALLPGDAPADGIPLAHVSLPDPAPAAVAAPVPAALPPGSCPDNDMACFLKAATSCTVASVNNAATARVLGTAVAATSAYAIAPAVSGCMLTVSVRSPAMQGSCTFAKKSDLAAVIKNWSAGTYSTADFAKASCSGTYFN